MKTLILLRHAKSSWDHPGLGDFDRPLSQRGLRDAPKMAQRLATLGVKLDVIISSPAKRALATAEFFADEMSVDHDRLQTEARIYEARSETLLDIVQELHNSWHCALMVGHNPGFSSLVSRLTDDGPGQLPTCSFALLDFDVDDWLAVRDNGASRLVYDFPKNKKPA